MKKALKLAVVVGGIGALAWSIRKRVRIAIGVGDGADPDFHIVQPVSESPADETPTETAPEVHGDTVSSSDEDPHPPSGASNGAG